MAWDLRLLTVQAVGLSVKPPRYSEHTDDVLVNMAGVSPDKLPMLRKEDVII